MEPVRECENCDKWYPESTVHTVVLGNHTEWQYCTECILENVGVILEVIKK